jgi:hypothetical protein
VWVRRFVGPVKTTQAHALVREHLATCQSCQLQLERYRRLSVCLANVRAAMPPADQSASTANPSPHPH